MSKSFYFAILFGLFSLFLWDCSSMSFIPPEFSLATTAYVNSTTARQEHETIKKLQEETQSLLDSLLEKDRMTLMEIEKKVKSQSFDIHQIKQQTDSLLQNLNDLQEQLKLVNNRTNSLESTLKDSLANIVAYTDELQTSLSSVQAELTKLNEANASVQQLSRDLQQRMQTLPEESLIRLKTILEESLSDKE